MFRSIADFLEVWEYEYQSTLNLFQLIDEKKIHIKPHDNLRTIARLSSHITETIGEMLQHAGLKIESYEESHDVFLTKAELLQTYERYAKAAIEAVQKNWTNAQLNDQVSMYGETWSKGKVLDVLVHHQTHHRGQLTTIMRLLDMPVVGMYGPSYAEWVQMNIPPMD
ncbi:MAG: DinB family protein [Bacteroidia bacterium]